MLSLLCQNSQTNFSRLSICNRRSVRLIFFASRAAPIVDAVIKI